ncbi:MAG: hypothetical protein EA350_10740 [Gemmatimonadales bacterium]|nr:MAG: hypothetical protein EA350_10740 [Gemmatimonadales bacterium]
MLLAAGPLEAAAQGAPAGADGDALRLLFDARVRHETVESGAFEADARALTARVRTGIEARLFTGVDLLAEVDANQAFGLRDFNSTVNGRTEYPAIVDPNSQRINRLHLSLRSADGRHLVAGRQRIIHDDARFVGNVGFRQNEQTLDAVRLRMPLPGQTALDYAFAWQANRVFGGESPLGTEDGRLHMGHLSRPMPGGTVTGFGYWFTFREALSRQSSRTLGARFRGSHLVTEDLRLHVLASAADQRALGEVQADVSVGYVRVEGGVAHAGTGLSTSVNWERLGGDGDRGFSFPLATLHAWQGFTDVFLATPPDGLHDLRLEAAWDGSIPGGGVPARVAVRRHAFRSLHAAPGSLGGEWNLEVRVVPRSGLTVLARIADYTTETPETPAPWGSDVRKFWLSVEYARP